MKTIVSIIVLLFVFTLASLAWGQDPVPRQFDLPKDEKYKHFLQMQKQMDQWEKEDTALRRHAGWSQPLHYLGGITPHEQWENDVTSRLARLEQQVDSLKGVVKMAETANDRLRGGIDSKGFIYGFDPAHVTAIWGTEKSTTLLIVDGEKICLMEPAEKVAKNLGIKITAAP